ncbi:MAG: prolyl-tRNA synthetase associated domain-containing protein [Hyphomicrobiaceae bacterium]|nr:prolyl-tRNA synthetase associated domain-containing protein [Hyphomicrobiaceae bacterium]
MTSTHATRPELFTRLAELGIETTTVEHPAVFTVGESDALERDLPGGHTKNLLLKDAKGKLFLVVAEAHASIDLKSLHKILDCARLSFAKPELLLATLGVQPGSVTALAVINDCAGLVDVIIDQTLMNYDLINCHPLENTATTAIARDDLLRFIRATDHEPRIVALPVRNTEMNTAHPAPADQGTAH